MPQISDTPILLARNQNPACCQLCVVTCAPATCEQKAFIFLQPPHPRKVFFRQEKGEGNGYRLALSSLRNPDGSPEGRLSLIANVCVYKA